MDKENEMMWDDWEKENAKIVEKNKEFLDIVKKEKGVRFYNKILLELGEMDDWYADGFTEKPYGEKQHGEKTGIEEWCHQYSCGYNGDTYSGYLYFQVKENKFLQVHYDC
jgi:hypothetical protein